MRRSVAVLIVLAGACLAPVSKADPLPWPLTGSEDDRKLISVMEYMDYGGKRYIHAGVDIEAAPAGEPGAPWVVAVAAGYVDHTWTETTSATDGNQVAVVADDGTMYLFVHLDGETLSQELDNVRAAANASGLIGHRVEQGAYLSQIGQFPANCADGRSVHHLHLEILNGDRLLEPLSLLEPYPDEVDPEIEAIHVCDAWHQDVGVPLANRRADPTWSKCQTLGGASCGALAGASDILVTVLDRQTETSPHVLGVREWVYRLCPENEPDCADWHPDPPLQTEDVPALWKLDDRLAAAVIYSWREDYVSENAYCEEDEFHIVATHVADGLPDAERSLDTRITVPIRDGVVDPDNFIPKYPDGFYTLSVRAVDFAGNETTVSVPVCVDNDKDALGKLLVRDCANDFGAEPSSCEDGGTTPDVELLTLTNGWPYHVIAAVRVTNVGARPLQGPLSMKIVAESGDYREEIESDVRPISELWWVEQEDDPEASWEPGQERWFFYGWAPAIEYWEALAAGPVDLVFAVSSIEETDNPNEETDVTLDNNRTVLRVVPPFQE